MVLSSDYLNEFLIHNSHQKALESGSKNQKEDVAMWRTSSWEQLN